MDNQALSIKMGLQAWDTQLSRTSKLIDSLTDEQWQKEIAPGKNRISYLVGHLIAIHDKMIELYGLGQRSHQALDEPFLTKPDRAVEQVPSVPQLREYWKKTHEELGNYFQQMSTADWFSKHAAVSEEDFAKQPERNKLNLLLNRTNHLAYHFGQMILVK